MEWSDIRVFLAVARTGSLGAAAPVLGLTQPTVGRRIDALETAAGQVLFRRSHKGLALTEEGQGVLAVAERMEEEAFAFQRRLDGATDQLSGSLRVTASDWFGTWFLAPAMSAFGLSHPDIELELLTDARLLDLSRREADLAFRITPFTGPGIVSRKFLQLDYRLYASKTCEPSPDDPALRLITMDAAFSEMPDAIWLARSYPAAKVVFRSNSREAQARACAMGVGVAVLPTLLAAKFPGLVALAPATEPPPRTVWMGYHEDLRNLKRLRALIESLSEAAVTE